MNPVAAEFAREVIDEVIESSIEAFLADDRSTGRRFDRIFFADTLEHMVDPWRVLAGATEAHLTDRGQVFVSVPNVAHWRVLRQLTVRGDWRYDDEGVFDRTHLRWFGRSTVLNLLEEANLRPVVFGGLVEARVKGVGVRRLVQDVRRWPKWSVFSFHILAERTR